MKRCTVVPDDIRDDDAVVLMPTIIAFRFQKGTRRADAITMALFGCVDCATSTQCRRRSPMAVLCHTILSECGLPSHRAQSEIRGQLLRDAIPG
jgi:hypothetical protein